MALVNKSIFKRAVENVGSWGDTDIFPFPIENHVLHDMNSEVADLLEEIAKDFNAFLNGNPVHNYPTLAPVGYTGFRWATQIDPLWNAYLLGMVLSLAQEIEMVRIPSDQKSVFSYRYQAAGSSLFDAEGWRRFQEETRQRGEKHRYVVSVDIADFYSRVYHHRVENALNSVDPGKMKTSHIKSILSKLSGGTSYGLPVGGPAARLLSELVLNKVDYLLLANSATSNFCRYADDYRFFVNDMQSAYRAIGFLSEKLLRNEGLALQKGKTRIMSSGEYISTLDPPEPPAGSAAKFLGLHIHFDPYSATAKEDYRRLRSSLHEFDIIGLLRAELTKGRIHTALAKRLIAALKFMDIETRKQAVISLLENIDTLAPVVPQVMVTIRDCVDEIADEEFTEIVHARIRSLIDSSHYVANIDLNLAFMIRVLASRRSLANEQLLIRLYNSNHGFGSGPAPTIQRDVMLIMARWGIDYWLSDQKNYVAASHAWVRRAFIISSYSLGDEGHHWRILNKSLGPFDAIVKEWTTKRIQAIPNWRVPI